MRLRIVGILVCASILSGCGGDGGGIAFNYGETQVGNSDSTLSVAAAAAGKTFFVGYSTPTILAYDEGSLARVGQIKTAGPNIVALTLSPGGQTLFAALGTYGTSPSNKTTSLLAINTSSMTTSKTVTLSGQIVDLRESNNAAVLVAAVQLQSGSYLYVFNPVTLGVVKKIALPAFEGVSPTVVVYNDGTTAFVNVNDTDIERIDVTHGTASLFAQPDSGAAAIALDALDRHLFAAFADVAIVDTATGTQTGSVANVNLQNIDHMTETADKRTIVAPGLCQCGEDFLEADGISSGSASVIKQFATGPAIDESDFAAVNGTGTETFLYQPNFALPYLKVYNPMNGGFLGYVPSSNPSSYVTAVAAQ